MRVVFLSDSHLGFDLPVRPRVQRRRRGDDFFDNFERVLTYAVRERADLVLHGGDLFFRSKVPPSIVDRVYQRLTRLADQGIELGLIAGNHERSALPRSLLLSHPRIHVFHAASTHVFTARGERLAVTGVPFLGHGARFVAATEAALADAPGDVHARVLLAHEAFDGAVVGPANFTFRAARRCDTIALEAFSRAPLDRIDAVLSGHIHRRQVLWADTRSNRRIPIVYAGSIERTSHAEEGEQKGFCVIDFDRERGARGRIRFVPLPTRPLEPRWSDARPTSRPTGLQLREHEAERVTRMR